MALSDPGRIRAHWSGRSFNYADPERQGEMAGFIRTAPADIARPASRSNRLDRTRLQPEREPANFEGSSSRRSR